MAADGTQQGRPGQSAFAGLEPGLRPGHHGLRGGGLARGDAAESLERGLGWFSMALGAAAIAAPRVVCWLSGLRSPTLVRWVGTRDLTAGIGILTQRDRAPWLWSRVVGDTFNLAALYIALGRRGGRGRASVALAAVAGVTALDLLAAMRLTGRRTERTAPGGSGRTNIYLERTWADVPTLGPGRVEETGRPH